MENPLRVPEAGRHRVTVKWTIDGKSGQEAPIVVDIKPGSARDSSA